MKHIALFILATLLVACEKPKPPAPQKKIESVADIETPRDVPPPVETKPFESGYDFGVPVGEAAAKVRDPAHPKLHPKLPIEDELNVLALDAAGADSTRAEKWQRGFVSGFKDGFARIAQGKK
jgi:hypothetical protein